MTSISFNMSGKINPDLVNFFRIIKREADGLGFPFFVVGATARDILLEHCYAKQSPRKTADVDIGIEVGGWDEYHKLSEALIKKKFAPTDDPFKFRFDGIPLDVVPFGATGDGGTIIRHPLLKSIRVIYDQLDKFWAFCGAFGINEQNHI